MVVKALYSVFLGLLVVLFVVWAMQSLYPAPEWKTEYPGVQEDEYGPEKPYRDELEGLSPAEKRAKFRNYEARLKDYQVRERQREKLRADYTQKVERHGRNVAVVSLVIAVGIVGFSLRFSNGLPVIAEGLLLGGLFTLIYSMGWSFVRSPKIAVVIVGVGLVVTIAVGYRKFARTRAG